MAATDPVITLAAFLKLEAPDGDVRLCDGGMLDFDSERYESQDAVFGTIAEAAELEAAFGDAAEDGQLILAPNPEADLADWWREDLPGCRIRAWMGEVDADGVTVTNAEQLADWLVDTGERLQQEDGGDMLALELIGRPEKLFIINEGNVCSDRFHQTLFSGELGMSNCTDLQGFVAWGAASPTRSTSSGGGLGPIKYAAGGLGALLF
jgi:hypothetical protein